MNIIWKKPGGAVAVSYLTTEVAWLAEEAERLLQSGAVPSDWTVVAIDYPLPATFAECDWSWDALAGALVENLQSARLAKWDAIKTERDRRKVAGVRVGEKWFHSDDGSRIQLMGLVMMGANIPAGLKWKTMDGSFVDMTAALAQQVFTAIAASDQAIFAAAEAHRITIESNPSPTDYEFSGGWPLAFGE